MAKKNIRSADSPSPATPATPERRRTAVIGGAALVTAATLVQGPTGFFEVLAQQPLGGVPYVFLLALGTWLAFLALTSLPGLLSVRQGVAE